MIRVTVWGENVHERTNEVVRSVYPEGMHTTIAEGFGADPEIEVRTATLDQDDDHGLSETILDETDVLVWWGHAAHGKVRDEVVARAKKRVLEGMGLILLHSAHYSKIFKSLMGTTCSLCWREAGEKERLWVCNPGHPITQGLGKFFELPQTEMYGEPFGVPAPDEQIFISWFEGGEVFRSGITYFRGNGRIFYFRPGHETFPIFYDDNVRLVLRNAVGWAQPVGSRWVDTCPNVPIDQAPEPITRRGKGLHQDGDEGFR
jgi:trehalose utilization protein